MRLAMAVLSLISRLIQSLLSYANALHLFSIEQMLQFNISVIGLII